jgi:phosphatidylinositol alpha-1,6-mannosyltransferase
MMGVDGERFRPDVNPRLIRDRYGLDGARVLLTVGRLVERKGHDVVIRALRRVSEAIGPVRYLIAGSGSEERRLRALAADLGCADEVIFIGHVSDEDLPPLYAACDVFVMPSRALQERDGIEGFGIVFLEAGASGKPVIGGRSGGITDAVLDGTTGVLVNPQDVEEIAEALIRLLRDREDAARMGEEGRRRAEALRLAWGTEVVRAWAEAELTHDGA